MLSEDASTRLLDVEDHPALVSGPVLRVADLNEDDDKGQKLFGFIRAHVAELRDGNNKAVTVKLPEDLQVHGRLITSEAQPYGELKMDTLVKIQRMIRLPSGDILVHDVDIVGASPPLQVSEMIPIQEADRLDRLIALYRPLMREDQDFPDDELIKKVEDFVQGVLDVAEEAQMYMQG